MKSEVRKVIRNNKSFIIIALLLWIIIGFSSGTADYYQYSEFFDRVASGFELLSVEYGYVFLISMASKLGMDYPQFISIYTFIAILLIALTVIRYAKKPSLVLLFYFCYPFFLDVTQLRHFMISAIVIYAIKYLEKFSIRNLIIYILCILIASTQQITAFIYLLMLIVYLPSNRIFTIICLWGSIVLSLFVTLLPNTVLFKAIVGLRNVDKYYASGMNGMQLYLYVSFFLLLIIICLFLARKHTETVLRYGLLHKICFVSLLFIPFLLLDFQYTRFFRGVIVLLYIYLTNLLYSKNNAIFQFIRILIVILMISVSIKLFGPGSAYYKTLTLPIIESNLLLK